MFRTPLLVATALCLVSASLASAGPITSMTAYGDSYSDSGNLGRESNGPVIVEQLAADLGVPLTDHAWVGATTGIGNLSDGGDLTSLGGQNYPGMTTTVSADLSQPPANIASTLFIVWGGHNDILINGQNQGVFNVVNMVRSLQGAGAQHILVPGVVDLGLTPFGNGSSHSQQLTAISTTFNAQLQQLLPTGVVYIDSAVILQSIVANPAAYGLTNVTSPCRFPTLCSTPDQYLFWDSFHPTTRADSIFAADFAAAVTATPEPCSSVLVLAALLPGALFAVHRRSERNFKPYEILRPR